MWPIKTIHKTLLLGLVLSTLLLAPVAIAQCQPFCVNASNGDNSDDEEDSTTTGTRTSSSDDRDRSPDHVERRMQADS